jgi:hypothetical protein
MKHREMDYVLISIFSLIAAINVLILYQVVSDVDLTGIANYFGLLFKFYRHF